MVPFRSRSSPGWQRAWENLTAPLPLYRNYSRYRHNGALAAAPLTPALLRLDPMFDPLGMIRALKLVASPAPNDAKQ